MTPYEAFDRDIPESIRDDVMTQISEASHRGEGRHGNVYILEETKHNVINVTVSGIFTLGDKEFWFLLDDGDWNGTFLRGWEEAGQQKLEESPPTQWALVPTHNIIADALAAERGNILLQVWEAFLLCKEIAEIPGKYAYDKFFAPGGKTENYWRDRAAKYKLELTSQEHADEVRKRLRKDAP